MLSFPFGVGILYLLLHTFELFAQSFWGPAWPDCPFVAPSLLCCLLRAPTDRSKCDETINLVACFSICFKTPSTKVPSPIAWASWRELPWHCDLALQIALAIVGHCGGRLRYSEVDGFASRVMPSSLWGNIVTHLALLRYWSNAKPSLRGWDSLFVVTHVWAIRTIFLGTRLARLSFRSTIVAMLFAQSTHRQK